MKPSLASYIIGFILSLVFTLGAAWIVWEHVSSGHTVFAHAVIIPIILALAIAQMIIQLVFFMHLGAGEGSRWNFGALISTVGIILIIVIGSIWIMDHLNYNMMASPADMNAYIQSQDGF